MRTSAAGVFVCLVVVAGCEREPAQPDEPPAPIALDDLRRGTYRGFENISGPVTLDGGRFEDQAARASVSLARDYFVTGDLDGAAPDEAVAVLASNTGGTGTLYHLAVVTRRDRGVVNVATAALGDRVQIRDLRVENRQVVADVLQAGAGDAMCCPGDLVTRTWALDGATLAERAPGEPTRLSLDVLTGTTWVLQAWSLDETAPVAPPVTLQYREGRLAGSSGCNSYTAGPTALEAPGDLSIGPAGLTRKMCPEAEMAVEARYVEQLGAVTKYGFMLGQLALTYRTGEGVETMLFSRQ